MHIKKLDGEKIITVSSGFSHTLALSLDYKVYGWGNNDKHQLGFPDKALKC